MESLKKKIYDSYVTPPSPPVVLVGLGIGALRIATSNVFFDTFPRFKQVLPPPKNLNPLMIIPITTALIAAFVEEPMFRGNLNKDSTYQAILINTLIFGAVHGLLKGTLEQRISRVVYSTIGGAFYAAAQILTGSIWAPTIAHLMSNSYRVLLPLKALI